MQVQIVSVVSCLTQIVFGAGHFRCIGARERGGYNSPMRMKEQNQIMQEQDFTASFTIDQSPEEILEAEQTIQGYPTFRNVKLYRTRPSRGCSPSPNGPTP
jgi:hypothetical protein